MQILKNLLVKGKLFLDNIVSMGTGALNALVLDGNEVKTKQLGSIALKNDNEYLSEISISVPSIFSVSSSPSAPDTNQFIIVLSSQIKNQVFAAPTNANGTPSFRLLVENDIPDLSLEKITGLQDLLNTLSPPYFYLEDTQTFDSNKYINQNTPRYINLENHLNLQDSGAYSFEIEVLFHCNHRQYQSSAYRHFHLVAKRTYHVTVITDLTSARTRRIANLKTVSHSGHWLQYNTSGTAGSSVINNSEIIDQYITAKAVIADGITPTGVPSNTAVLELSHSLNDHPGLWPDISYLLYAKYRIKYNSFKTSQTS